MTELILIRHGETDWNRELRFQGQVDVPLNAMGLEQARRVAQRLLAERFGVEHLVCSDLLRTRQTAEPATQALLPHLSLDAVADPGLREQNFGIVDGLRVQDVKTDYAEAWERWVRFEADYGMPGGVEGHIHLALEAQLAVPVGFAMADEDEFGHAPIIKCRHKNTSVFVL